MRKKFRLPRLNVAAISGIVILLALAAFFLLKPAERPSISVYFIKEGKLTAVERTSLPNEAPLQKALRELMAGPTAEEKLQGYATQIPAKTRVKGSRVRGKVAILDFTRELENYGGGSTRLQDMIAQIVFTATAIPGIEKAWIWEEGRKNLVLGGEGLVIDRPLSRRDISD